MKPVFTLFFLYLTSLVFQAHTTRAQQNNRIELDRTIGKVAEGYDLIPMGRQGFIIFNGFSHRHNHAPRQLDFSFYDAELNKSWESKVDLDANLEFYQYYYDTLSAAPKMYVLISNELSSNQLLLTVDGKQQRIHTKRLDSSHRLRTKRFAVYENTVYFISGDKGPQGIVCYSPDQDKYTFTESEKEESLQDILIDTVKRSVTITAIIRQKKGEGVKLYGFSKGQLTYTRSLPIEDASQSSKNSDGKPILLEGKTSHLDGQILTAGTYTTYLTPEGIYIGNLTDEAKPVARFYRFVDLKRFFPEPEPGSTKKSNPAKRPEKLPYKSRVALHRLIPYKDQYLLIGEVYEPDYSSLEGIGTTNGFKKPTTYYRDGDSCTQIFCIGFDKQGNYLWDNSVKLKGRIRSHTFEAPLHLSVQNQGLKLTYSAFEKIYTQFIPLNDSNSGLSVSSLSESNAGKAAGQVHSRQIQPVKDPSLSYSVSSHFTHWYGPYSLVWGLQAMRQADNKLISFFYVEKTE